MKIIKRKHLQKTKVQMDGAHKAWRQLAVSSADGSPRTAVRVFTLRPGGHTPYHRHPFEHVNYVIRGTGVLVGENRKTPIREGDFALVLPNEKHQYRNTSSRKEFVFICAVPKKYE